MLKVVGASWLQTKISSYVLAGMGILGIVALFVGEVERIEDDGNYAATVYWSTKAGFRIEFWGQGNELAQVPEGVARAYYRPDLSTTGWSLLEIESDANYPDWVQAYAAGLLEGALTWQLIHWHWQNIIESRCAKHAADCEKIRKVLEDNITGVRSRGIRNQEDALWHQINLYYHQVDGLSTGWNFAVKRSRNELEIPLVDFIWLNSLNDVAVIERMLNISSRAKAGENLPGLAASFIRLVTDDEDKTKPKREKAIVSHNSAGSYSMMLRLMKHYKLKYHHSLLPSSSKVHGTSISFSGYPAAVSSLDDLYTIAGPPASRHHMTVTGTAINNFNSELWSKVNLVDHVLIGPRVMAANRLASDGLHWSRLISRVNSGTALTQWTVVNLAKLALLNATAAPAPASSKVNTSPDNSVYRYIHSSIDGEMGTHPSMGRLLRRRVWRSGGPGLLWAIEQVPGHTHAADQTNVLRAKGYWADYGIPHYQDIKEISGIKKMESEYGDTYSLLKSARAILFKNGFETATDIESVILLMRSNHYDKEVVSNDKLATPKPHGVEEIEEIEPEDIVSDSQEVKQIIQSLETVKSHIESTDSDGVASILTLQEQKDITSQVDEILEQLSLSNLGESNEDKGSESASAEHLNLDSDSVEEIEDRLVDEGSWHGLGARGDLHGWLGEEQSGLVPMGVIDTKALGGTSDGIREFEAISGPSYSRALETSLESLLKPATRKKAKFGLAALLDKIRKSNIRFVSSEESTESEEEEDQEPKDFEEALEHVVNTNIQIDPPKPYSVPPFQWSKSDFAKVLHIGQPDLWAFDPIKPAWVW